MSNNKPKTPSVFHNRNFFLIATMLLMVLFFMRLYNDEPSKDLTRTEFFQMMADSSTAIKSLQLQRTVDGIVIEGTRAMTPEEIAQEDKKGGFLSKFAKSKQNTEHAVAFTSHVLDLTSDQIDSWEKTKSLKVRIKHETASWVDRLFAFLPAILLIVFFWYMMARQTGGGKGGMGMFSFGKSKARQLNENGKTKTTFKDVAGCDEAKADLEEIVQFLKDPKKYDDLGGRIPKGALLVGPPGTGKTLLARAVAGEAGVPFFSMSGSDFVEMFVGVGAARVRDLFDLGKKNAPCILFIDEIDAVGRQRGAGLGGGHDEREQTLNQLLVEMDGFAPNAGVILIAATNRPDVLDKALLRPGRFDRQIMVGLPDLVGREAILNVHLKKRKVPVEKDVDIKDIARGTPGLAGADLENLINEAALLAARFNNKKVTKQDFEEARDKLAMGSERRSLLMSDEEKRHTAFHEAGHALMTLLCPHADPLHKITIIPRGRALGITMSLPENDRVSLSKESAEENIMILMSGRLAELLVFNHQSTGASNDIARATDLARKMVTEWGFDDSIGPLCYSRNDGEIFLGREINKPKEMSEKMAEAIDGAINSLVKRLAEKANGLLVQNRAKLDLLGNALVEYEVLDRDEVDRILAGEKLDDSKKSRTYLFQQEQAKKREQEKKDEEPPPDPGRPAPIPTEVTPIPEDSSVKGEKA